MAKIHQLEPLKCEYFLLFSVVSDSKLNILALSDKIKREDVIMDSGKLSWLLADILLTKLLIQENR